MGFQSFFCVYFSARKSNMIDKCAAVRYNNTVHFMTPIEYVSVAQLDRAPLS